ncbi:MAG TPA: acyltransferase domain-containing protein [Jatrophihabitans sp.]|nr:acyltransferase domain-containing protein [Jatrophihabitans sp.]
MIAVLAPGQGSQTPGMLTPWLELDGVAEQVAGYSELAGLDLTRLGTTAAAEEIVDTAVTQPLIVAMGLITARQLELPESVVVAGHSIGEVTAAAIAGVLTEQQAITFAARRGQEMAAACQVASTGMAAALGGDPEVVVAAILARGLTPANRNGAGQIVAAGASEAIADLVSNPPEGTRFRLLPVAGAFHTDYMRSAELSLRTVAADIQPADPRLTLLSNADGTAVTDGRTVLARLVAQVTRPVRWDLCLNTLRELGVRATVELPPAKALTGIAKRELPGIELLALKGPDDLAAARQLLASRPQPAADSDVRVVSTPSQGIFTRARGVDAGAAIVGGTRLGTVRTNRDELAIVAPVSGVLAEWFRNDGDIVGAGLPVARLSLGSEAR